MKTTYKFLMALAASLLLVPALFAQDPYHEKYVEDKMVGVNKYLVSDTPNSDGEYTIRLETFTTGTTSSHAVPTDFVLVLDTSGSMQYDCLFGKSRPSEVTRTQNETEGTEENPNEYYNFLRKAHTTANLYRGICHYTYDYGWSAGNVGETGTGERSDVHYFYTSNTGSSLYYYYAADDTYYKIFRETDNSHYRFYITTQSAGKLYLRSTNATTITLTPAADVASYDGTWNNSSSKVLLIGGFNSGNDNIWRPQTRRDALQSGVTGFINSIKGHNQTDNFEAGITKHRVAMVAFGSGYSSGSGNNENPSTASNTSYDSNSKVVYGFQEINATNATQYINATKNVLKYTGWTYTFLGMRLAKRLLQQNQSGAMAPVNASGGTNRNKVVVVFTDGEPSPMRYDGVWNGSSASTSEYNAYYNAKLCLSEAKIIKAAYGTGSGTYDKGTQAKIFAIDLVGTTTAQNFLERLSSDYPEGIAVSGDQTLASITYDGDPIEDIPQYYMDANAGGLEDAFISIVDASTGNFSANMVAVDVISDSFELPEGFSTSGKVKLYTAQCIGKKTIDGNEYLAFAQPVPVDERAALEHLWINTGVDEHDEPVWVDKGIGDDGEAIDIDANVSFHVYEFNGKQSVVFTGFGFADLWCGLDADHNNTRTTVAESDPNYGNQLDGYRGFKLVAEFPIVVAENAVGGPGVATNDYRLSGLFNADDDNNPTGSAIVNYPKPVLTIPIKLIIQKTGLNPGESASFTIQCKEIGGTGDYEDLTTFVLTGNASASNVPEIKLLNLDPSYYYRVKETGWSWAYENADPSYLPSTEDPDLANPIVFQNNPVGGPKHAEAKAVNKMRATGSETETVYDITN